MVITSNYGLKFINQFNWIMVKRGDFFSARFIFLSIKSCASTFFRHFSDIFLWHFSVSSLLQKFRRASYICQILFACIWMYLNVFQESLEKKKCMLKRFIDCQKLSRIVNLKLKKDEYDIITVFDVSHHRTIAQQFWMNRAWFYLRIWSNISQCHWTETKQNQTKTDGKVNTSVNRKTWSSSINKIEHVNNQLWIEIIESSKWCD